MHVHWCITQTIGFMKINLFPVLLLIVLIGCNPPRQEEKHNPPKLEKEQDHRPIGLTNRSI